MSTVSAALLEARRTRVDIEFIVGDEHLFGGDLVELGEGRYGLATAVHKGGGDQQAQVVTCKLTPAGQAEKLRLGLQGGAARTGQRRDKPGSRVVARAIVFAARAEILKALAEGCIRE